MFTGFNGQQDWDSSGRLTKLIGYNSDGSAIGFGNNSTNTTIPTSIGQAVYLEEFDVQKNNFNGTLPVEIASLINSLEVLLLQDNRLESISTNGDGDTMEGGVCYLISNGQLSFDIENFNILNNNICPNIISEINAVASYPDCLLTDEVWADLMFGLINY